jgi:rare lipoprotein A
MRRVLTHSMLVLVLAGTLGAAPGQETSNSIAKTTPATKHFNKKAPKPYQVGRASWYGRFFHGKPTASGESYDMFRYTAAHPALPLGTWVRVTNLQNEKSVIVRINDRGPVVPGRIIDLSYSAAQTLEFRRKGLTRVRLDIISEPENVVAAARQDVGTP